jgi:hypothetical protein
LLAGGQEPIAVFTVDGQLIAATESAHAHLRGATSLAGIGAVALIGDALATGHAVGCSSSPISLDRIGGGAATVLIAQFDPSAAATAPAPVPPPSPATPTERRHPLRFVWQMDEGGHFTLSSDEFIVLTGARTAAAIGRPWQEVANELGLDPGGQVARALATHDTWSGLSIFWPVEASSERLAIELSGLPVFDRNRAFRGYRGFGVCREIAHLNALAQKRQAANAAAQDVAQNSDQTGERNFAPSDFAIAPPGENILHFPRVSEPHAPALSAIERNAFRELTRKLTQSLTGIEPTDQAEVPTPIEEEDGVAPARAMDVGVRSPPTANRLSSSVRKPNSPSSPPFSTLPPMASSCSMPTASSCPPTAALGRCSATSRTSWSTAHSPNCLRQRVWKRLTIVSTVSPAKAVRAWSMADARSSAAPAMAP